METQRHTVHMGQGPNYFRTALFVAHLSLFGEYGGTGRRTLTTESVVGGGEDTDLSPVSAVHL